MEVKPWIVYVSLWAEACSFILLSTLIFGRECFFLGDLPPMVKDDLAHEDLGASSDQQKSHNGSLCCVLAELAVGVMAFYCFRYLIWCHSEHQSLILFLIVLHGLVLYDLWSCFLQFLATGSLAWLLFVVGVAMRLVVIGRWRSFLRRIRSRYGSQPAR